MPITARPAKLKLELTRDDLALLCEALDSHTYWQLSDPEYRESGSVCEPGSDDADSAAEIRRSEVLQGRLAAALAGEGRPARRPAR